MDIALSSSHSQSSDIIRLLQVFFLIIIIIIIIIIISQHINNNSPISLSIKFPLSQPHRNLPPLPPPDQLLSPLSFPLPSNFRALSREEGGRNDFSLPPSFSSPKVSPPSPQHSAQPSSFLPAPTSSLSILSKFGGVSGFSFFFF